MLLISDHVWNASISLLLYCCEQSVKILLRSCIQLFWICLHRWSLVTVFVRFHLLLEWQEGIFICWLAGQVPTRAEARPGRSQQVGTPAPSHSEWQNSSTWSILCYLPEALPGMLDQKPGSRDWNLDSNLECGYSKRWANPLCHKTGPFSVEIKLFVGLFF